MDENPYSENYAELAASANPGEDAVAGLSVRVLGELQSARALPDLFRLYELREDVGDLGPLARIFDQVASDRRARPDLRSAALQLRGRIRIIHARGSL